MLDYQKAKNKLLKLLKKTCVGCRFSSIDTSNNKLKCYIGTAFKKVNPEYICNKFIFSDYRSDLINNLLVEFPKLKKDDEIIELAKKSKVKLR